LSSSGAGIGVVCVRGREIDECTAAMIDCDATATCADPDPAVLGDATCSCPAGFEGDGLTSGDGCTDIDECTLGTSTCDTNAACTNVDGSFTCACDAGFTGDGATCADVDECTLGTDTCDANAACTNIDGSFTCACDAGYTDDGTTCADDDECTLGTSDCSANADCTNTVGSFTCACQSGFSGNGQVCADIDECNVTRNNNCDVNAICLNNEGAYTCVCFEGFEGTGFACHDVNECEETGDKADTCAVEQDCVNNEGSFACVDKTGTTDGTGVTDTSGAEIPDTDTSDTDDGTDTSDTDTSGTGSTNTNGSETGLGGVFGDPHVVVSSPGQPDVCFDFGGANGEVVTLLADFETGLEVNGLLNGPVTKSGTHPRLNNVGIVTPNNQIIDFYPDYVLVNEQIELAYADMTLKLNDGTTLQLHDTTSHKHSGGVVLLDDGTIFEVLSKVNKQSLQFQVVSSKGLSNSLGGVLGVNLRTFQFNLDTKNQTIQMIDSGESVSVTLNSDQNCWQIETIAGVNTFLGHSINEFNVSKLNGRLAVALLSDRSPK